MEKAINFGLRLLGVKYCWWYKGHLCDDAPAWAGILSPDVDLIREKGLFCAGLVNVMLREIGLQVPENPPFNGGTYAYGINYTLIPFSLCEIRRGDAVFRLYQDTIDQGHIGIALGGANDPLLQCFAFDTESSVPGVNISYTVKESHCGYYYQYIIKREELWQWY
jgi:hypothetical protein